MEISDTQKHILSGIAVFLLFTALIWDTHVMLSPIVVGGLLIFLLSSMKGFPLSGRLRVMVIIILSFWFLIRSQGVIVPFVVAFIFAYILNPVADQLERWRIPRTAGVVFIFFMIIALFFFLGLILIPDLARELQDMIIKLPQLAEKGMEILRKYVPKLLGFLKVDPEKLQKDILEEKYPTKVEELLLKLLSNVTGVGAVFSQLLNIILIPVLTFYFLKDYNKIKEWVLHFLPKRHHGAVYFYLWRSNRILGGYIRGHLIVTVWVAVFTWLGLFLFSIPYAIMVGLIAGLLNIIPFIGFYVSFGIALLSAFFTSAPQAAAMKITLVFMVVQGIEAYIISPKIVGDRVGLHPVAVIFSILVFSRFLGFWGLIIAVPLAALIKFLISEWKRHQEWKDALAKKCGTAKN
jgi:predicted PurR-regulated permease PerM